jgi:hypothetical protein
MTRAKDAVPGQDRMFIQAKTAILNRDDFLPATEVARMVGFSSTNLSV